MTERFFTIKEAAERMGLSIRYICQLCSRGMLPGAVKKNGKWLIPATAHPKLAEPADNYNLPAIDIPQSKKDEAFRRAGIIEAFVRFAAEAVKNKIGLTEALRAYALQHNIAVRSLERWLAAYRTKGVEGLIDTRGKKGNPAAISEDAFELFKSMYLTQQRLSVKLCLQNVDFTNKNEKRGWQIPLLAAMYKIIKREIPLPVQVLHREGMAAYTAQCEPYILIDYNTIEPGAVWVGDHSQLNCWVRHRGQWVRPWITAWEDMRSRLITGWRICASPNQTTIMLAFKRGIEKYGPPESVKIDNGKDYDSELFTGTTKKKRRLLRKGYLDEPLMAGLYAMMGIGVSFSIKYHPQSKPIEPWFNTLDCQFIKTIPTYCGKDTQRRPEELAEQMNNERFIAEAYDLNSIAELVSQYIEVYNKSAHSGRGMDGRSPTQVFAARRSQRVLTDGVLDLIMGVWSGELTVGKNGVQFRGLWYGQYDATLLMHQGKKVRLKYDPDDISKVNVYDAVTMRLITIAEQAQLIAYGATDETALRTGMAEKAGARKLLRQFCDKQLTANMDLPSLTIRAMKANQKDVPEPDVRSLKPVRTVFDSQVREHQRQQVVKAVRKASGGAPDVVLDMDFDLLKPEKNNGGVKLWDEKQ